MESTDSNFSITFGGKTVIDIGGRLFGYLPQLAFPISYAHSITPIIGSNYPRLDSWGMESMEFSISVILGEFATPESALNALHAWLQLWSTATKDTLTWVNEEGLSLCFEALLKSATPRIVDGLALIVDYDFVLGKPC